MKLWMILEGATINKLRLNSPPGGWFPALRDLSLYITESNLPYADLFFSPRLRRVDVYVSWPWNNTALSLGALQTLASIIPALPTSSLERISVGTNHQTMPWAHLRDSFSSTILRCGPSLTECDSPVPLSNAALDHLIHLPHLLYTRERRRVWVVYTVETFRGRYFHHARRNTTV